MQTVGVLLGKHIGDEAWLFGKGPGLDRFSMKRAGALRICINESLLHVHKPTYFFAHDEQPILRVAQQWPTGCKAILEPTRADFAVRHGIPSEDVYTYTKCDQDLSCLKWSADQIAKMGMLLGLSGTVHSAVHFCHLCGVSSAIFVGMEGRGGYAFRLGLKLPRGGGQYPRIRSHTIRELELLNMKYEFIDEPPDLTACMDQEN
jgi:hypothetical protein